MTRIITSWDDGAIQDLRVAQLLLEYALPGIFYIPGNSQLTDTEIYRLHKLGFEIGGHTETHPHDIKLLPYQEIKSEVENNKEELEILLGQKIKSFCYPRGRHDEIVRRVVKDAGYEWARTTVVKMGSVVTDDVFNTPTSVHCFNRSEYQGRDWVSVAKEAYLKAKEEDGLFHLWGHSWEIDNNNDWEKLEEVFKFINENR